MYPRVTQDITTKSIKEEVDSVYLNIISGMCRTKQGETYVNISYIWPLNICNLKYVSGDKGCS